MVAHTIVHRDVLHVGMSTMCSHVVHCVMCTCSYIMITHTPSYALSNQTKPLTLHRACNTPVPVASWFDTLISFTDTYTPGTSASPPAGLTNTQSSPEPHSPEQAIRTMRCQRSPGHNNTCMHTCVGTLDAQPWCCNNRATEHTTVLASCCSMCVCVCVKNTAIKMLRVCVCTCVWCLLDV